MTDDDLAVISYAQNREDIILSGFFSPEEVGFYVDVGAHDPVADSVTKYFYDRGWHGVNIEPLPDYYQRLVTDRPRDINVQVAIAGHKGTASLREYVEGTGLSTLSDTVKRDLAKGRQQAAREYRDHTVAVMPLRSLFKEQHITSISFMKIDVEGYEYDVLKSNDWKKYRPQVLCIEADHIVHDWRTLLKQEGYERIFFDGLNEYYVDKSRPDVRERFSYVMAVPFREPIVNYRLLPKIRERIALQQRVRDLEDEVAMKSAYAIHLERTIGEITPLRRHIRRQLKMRLRGIDAGMTARLRARRGYAPSEVALGMEDSADAMLELIGDADHANLEKYNQAAKQAVGLTIYMFIRRLAIGLVSRLLRLRKV